MLRGQVWGGGEGQIAAARAGAKTRLLEVHGCLGGVWTAGLLSWILDATNKQGLMREILAALERRKASTKYGSAIAYDAEHMKRMLEEMCLDVGVAPRLHTRVVAAACDASHRLNLLVTESKSGREAWAAKVFVDASGDGDLHDQRITAGGDPSHGRGLEEALGLCLLAAAEDGVPALQAGECRFDRSRIAPVRGRIAAVEFAARIRFAEEPAGHRSQNRAPTDRIGIGPRLAVSRFIIGPGAGEVVVEGPS